MAPCTICNESGGKECERCHAASYCSKECRKEDWRTHKLLCAELGKHTDRPGEDYRRAVLFPVKEAKPIFVWVEASWDAEFMPPNVESFMGSDKPKVALSMIKVNTRRGRVLMNNIVLHYREQIPTGRISEETKHRHCHQW